MVTLCISYLKEAFLVLCGDDHIMTVLRYNDKRAFICSILTAVQLGKRLLLARNLNLFKIEGFNIYFLLMLMLLLIIYSSLSRKPFPFTIKKRLKHIVSYVLIINLRIYMLIVSHVKRKR